MATTVSSVTSHFPSAENGFTTTTSGSVASGATSVGLNSVAGYANGEVFVGVIDPADTTKKQTFTGIVDTAGVQITGVVWTAGTNQVHSAGTTVVDYATATHISMISKGILVQHKQDGTHANTITTDTINENTAANGVTIDSLNVKDAKLNTANSVVTDNYTDGSILPEHLTTGTGTTWAWASWTPTLTNMTEGNGTKTGKYIQIGNTVFFKFQFTLGSTSAIGTDPQFSVPVTAIASDANSVIGQSVYRDAGTETYFGSVYLNATTTAKFNSNATDATWLRASSNTPDSTRPFTWTTNDIITAVGFYEAE